MNKKTKNLTAVLICFLAVCFVPGCTSGKNVLLSDEERQLDMFQMDVMHNLMTQSGEVILLAGDNGYQGVAKYFAPNSEGYLSRLALIMFKDDKAAAYDMAAVPSASGAKFSTREKDYVMWESKGEFNFYSGDAETLLSTLKKISLSKTAVIELEGNPTTGYTWVCTLSPQGVIREVSSEYVANTTAEIIAGSGGKYIFTFEAVAAGEAEIVFSYLRPWEESIPALETVFYKAIVDDRLNLIVIRK